MAYREVQVHKIVEEKFTILSMRTRYMMIAVGEHVGRKKHNRKVIPRGIWPPPFGA